MFKNFWYAVEFSHDVVAGKPKKVKILGQQLVLYRKTSDNSVVAMSDLCVHRGAALSGGEIKGDCIVCPYHGWEYEPERRRAEDPGAPRQGHPAQGAHRLLPGAGEVHVRLGLPRRPARGGAPADPGLVRHRRHRELPRRHGRVPLEVQLRADPRERRRRRPHAVRARRRLRQPGEARGRPSSRSRAPTWHCKVSVVLNPPNSKGIWGMLNPNKPRTCRSVRRSRCPTTWWLPNLLLLDVGTPMGQLKIFDVNIPIDEETTLVKFVALRTFFKGKWADRDARRRVFKVLYEDQAVVDDGPPRAAAVRPLRRAARQERLQRRALPPPSPGAHREGWGVEGNTIVGEGPARVEAAGHPVADPQGGARARERVELQGGPQPGDPLRQRGPHRARRRTAHRQPVQPGLDHRGDKA